MLKTLIENEKKASNDFMYAKEGADLKTLYSNQEKARQELMEYKEMVSLAGLSSGELSTLKK